MIRTFALLFALALGVDAQTPAALEAQIVAQQAEIVALQKEITILGSTVTMQAANLAALSKSFTPVQSAVTATQATDTTKSAAIAAVQAQLNLVASNPALQLGPFVKIDPNPENSVIGPNLVIHGANVHIINDGKQNVGNLIIGDDEGHEYYDYPDPPMRGGSYNLIIGPNNTWGYGSYNVLIGSGHGIYGNGGSNNCLIGGTNNNVAMGSDNVILGGQYNGIFGYYDVVGGGYGNSADGNLNLTYITLFGGKDNGLSVNYSAELGTVNP
jgi:hypothetical protein